MSDLTRLKLINALQVVTIAQAALGPFYVHDLGLTMGQISLLQAVGMAVMWLSTLVLGHITDRMGYRTTILVGNIVYVGVLFGYAHTNSFVMVMAAQVALVLCTTLLATAPSAWLSQVSGREYQLHASAAMSWLAIATGAAQLLGGFVAQWAGNRMAIALSMLVPLACIALAYPTRQVGTLERTSLRSALRVIHYGKGRPFRLVLGYGVMYPVAVAPIALFSAFLAQAGFAVWMIGGVLLLEFVGRFVPPILYGKIATLRELGLRKVVASYALLASAGYAGLFSRGVIGVPVGILLIAAAATWAMMYMRPRLLGHPAVAGNAAMVQSVVTFTHCRLAWVSCCYYSNCYRIFPPTESR